MRPVDHRTRYGRHTGRMQRIGGYAVERRLGEGGMGTVYLARSRGGRAVAVKVARPELAGDPAFRERFRACSAPWPPRSRRPWRPSTPADWSTAISSPATS